MSAKWRRVQAWDREHLTGPMAPIRWLLHTLSTITLAVVLLTGVSVYAVLASVPIGLLVLGLTWLVYIATLVLAVAVPAAISAFLVRLFVKPRLLRAGLTLLVLVGGGAVGAAVWSAAAWPALHYDPVTGAGLRLFPDFVETYRNTTLRRLPAFEMTELEFYAWWPMQLMLGLFVINMVVATIRRIEFRFVNIGVLTVHTGIVTISIGSLYYQWYKMEGDTILLAGDTGQVVGHPQQIFYDREDPALIVFDGQGWKQIPLAGLLPRYNDYALAAGMASSARDTLGFGAPIETASDQGRVLDTDLTDTAQELGIIPEGVSLRIVGYATYAEPIVDWVQLPDAGQPVNPLRMLYVVDRQVRETQGGNGRIAGFAMLPDDPQFAAVEFAGAVGVDYAIDADAARWRAISTPVRGANHAVVAQVGEELLVINADRPGRAYTLAGWTFVVEQVLPEPPFPIITQGYEDATSALAVVRVTTPEGTSFRRWVYHRFPEINQDLGLEAAADGRPSRSDPDPRLGMHYFDQSKLQLYVNEHSATGLLDVVFRFQNEFDTQSGLEAPTTYRTPIDRIEFDFGAQWDATREVERPVAVPPIEQEGDFIGKHDRAMVAVEIATTDGTGGEPWSQTVWLPFSRYAHDAGARGGTQRTVTLPSGRPVSLIFGRQWFPLPGFQLRLIDFEMIAYDHRGAPRDYQSLVRVEPAATNPALREPYDHVTKLNAPLKAPFLWSAARSLPANVVGELVSHLSPNQFKFSQAGWDRQGWQETQAQVDAGLLERPRVRFTILGVGNNPGIHVIALGGVLMGVGIPWAFYVKPWLVRRKKKQIQAQLAQQANANAENSTAPEPVGAAT